jgi:hypothetical protein
MRTKVRAGRPEAALTRIVDALELELIEASEQEILQAAQDLGMNPRMKGSVAFAGLKFPARPQLSDFFDLEVCRKLQAAAERQGEGEGAGEGEGNGKSEPKRLPAGARREDK